MAAYILRRMLWLIPALFLISLITFGLMHLTPGGPYDLDRPVPPAMRENLQHKYGLDKPLIEQYGLFVTNALQGDLGLSLRVQQDVPVTNMLLRGLRSTVVLGVLAFGLATIVGVSLGVIAALHRGQAADYVSTLMATAGSALPVFVIGILLIYVFATQLHWLPVQGWSLDKGVVSGWLPQPRYMLLPISTLAALPAAYLARITRAALLEVLQQDYMRTARAKGMPHRALVWRHGMRNAAVPIISVMGPLLGALITGSFIVESMFGVPGVGTLFIRGVSARDYNLIMGMTLFYATVATVLYLLVDVAYAYFDPRVRFR
jgi:oligopeptide transport system permease protein